jgi:hypothetical protein
MAGLDPAIQTRHSLEKAQFLDCWVKPGNDGKGG